MKLGCDWRRSRNPTLQWKSLRRGCHTSRTSCMLCWEGAGSQAAGAAALLPTQPAPPGTSAFSSSLESPGDLERPEDLERPGDLKHRESPTWLVDPGDLRTLTPIPAPHPPPPPSSEPAPTPKPALLTIWYLCSGFRNPVHCT